MTREEKIDAVYDTAMKCGGDVRTDYSGRGMMGETCYGIVCDDSTECTEMAAENGLRGARVDSMGKRSIVYWESISDKQ